MISFAESSTALWKTDSGILLKESMLEGWNSADHPHSSCLKNSLGCGTLFDLSGSSVSLPGLLKVVRFFSSLLGFTASANKTLVGDLRGLKEGLFVGQLLGKLGELFESEVGVLDGEIDGLLLGLSDGPLLGIMDGLLSGSALGRWDGPS